MIFIDIWKDIFNEYKIMGISEYFGTTSGSLNCSTFYHLHFEEIRHEWLFTVISRFRGRRATRASEACSGDARHSVACCVPASRGGLPRAVEARREPSRPAASSGGPQRAVKAHREQSKAAASSRGPQLRSKKLYGTPEKTVSMATMALLVLLDVHSQLATAASRCEQMPQLHL